MKLYPNILSYIENLDMDSIPSERKESLQIFIERVQAIKKESIDLTINFICTHNSRRSHLGQIWAQTMADYYGIKDVRTYSGGTEATAMYPQIVKTLEKNGFQIATLSDSTNPIFGIKSGPNESPMIGFSKIYDHSFNPSTGFIAIMTCDQANEACPLVTGAVSKIAITYEDPKHSDGTEQMTKIYEERSKQIATEMKYVFSKIN